MSEMRAWAQANLAMQSVSLIVSPQHTPFLDLAAGVLRTKASLVAAGDSGVNAAFVKDVSTALSAGRSGDIFASRLFGLMTNMAPDAIQGLGQGYAPFDLRGRFVELARDTLVAVRLAVPLPDSGHSRTDPSGGEGGALGGQRHGAVNHAVAEQSAKGDSLFAGAGRTSREILPASFDSESSDGSESTPGHATVGHLVAFDGAAGVSAAAVWGFGPRPDGDPSDGSTARHDLLSPRFAFDPALLGEAIREFVSEADELGISLLGFLTDPTSSTEMGLVAGVAAVGLAYRQWRGRERREEAEARAMLAARFVTGPASLRLGRKNAP